MAVGSHQKYVARLVLQVYWKISREYKLQSPVTLAFATPAMAVTLSIGIGYDQRLYAVSYLSQRLIPYPRRLQEYHWNELDTDKQNLLCDIFARENLSHRVAVYRPTVQVERLTEAAGHAPFRFEFQRRVMMVINEKAVFVTTKHCQQIQHTVIIRRPKSYSDGVNKKS